MSVSVPMARASAWAFGDCVKFESPGVALLIDSLRKQMGKRGGVWDVYCWNDERVLFVELKRGGRDRIRSSQRLFLETALNQKLPLDTFLIVEWNLGEPV